MSRPPPPPRQVMQRRRVRAAGLAAVAASLALLASGIAQAGTWSFATNTPLALGGSVSGLFSGTDANTDGLLEIGEVGSFTASYAGAPPATSGFAIAKAGLGAGDLFSFDLASSSLSFSVTDAAGRSIGGGSFEFTSVVGDGFVDAGGTLTVSAVPEPATVMLMVGGLMLIGWLRSRRRD